MKSYGPPSAPWIDDEDESVYPLVLRRTADVLVEKLVYRIQALRRDEVTADDVIVEIRRQIATSALDDPLGAGDLAEMLLELIQAKENARRAV